MTPLEAIPKITELMTLLIDRVKDRNTSSLISQIQSLNQTVQAGYFSSKEEALKLATENFDLKQAYAKEISDIKNKHSKEIDDLTAQITKLKTPRRTPKVTLINYNVEPKHDNIG